MSWKFGPFTVSTREVVDIDTINESFLSIVEEVTGELNEHNFAENAFNSSNRSLLADDIGLRIHHEKQAADPNLTASAAAGTPNTIPVSSNWRPVDPTLRKTITTKGGKLWVMASFQIRVNATFGALFSIEINGVVLGDALLGTGDIDNDQVAEPTGGTTFVVVGPSPTIWLLHAGAIVVEAVIPVSPGTFMVQPVMRNPKLGDEQAQEVSNRELIVVEQR